MLAGWDFEPDEAQVRLVSGDDGREKLQMRLDLGLLQMELTGRPDGQRPFGHESLLDYYESCARNLGESDASESASPEGFSLDSRACASLLREGLQYYHRYVALFHLERYDMVVRDTGRNLRLFSFVVRYASNQRDKLLFDQYRPYVLMMHTRSLGMQALAQRDHRAALDYIDSGIESIRAFLRDYDQADREAECPELAFLLDWRQDVDRARPIGPVERLEQQLSLAISLEHFEEAARLRDQIRRLSDPYPSSGAAPGR
ncbi:MAG TPA: UvrB/UvrC motif-containing protein [Isosphaeraceae bacterium]|jgi:hypothetical protein|nr:UvrB/UvrC motif-containing protein [Isosphaeraceae bacterium]